MTQHNIVLIYLHYSRKTTTECPQLNKSSSGQKKNLKATAQEENKT